MLRMAAWVCAVLAASIAVNLIGLHYFGGIAAWSDWLEAHRWWFLAWRICLYAGTIYGWWWMRQRLRRREPSRETRTRLLRMEVAAVLAILAIESAVLLKSP